MSTTTEHVLDRSLLTPRQAQILDLIHSYTVAHGYQPAIREMVELLDFKGPSRSTNAVYCHMRALEKKGWIELGGGVHQARALTFLARPDGRPFHGFTWKEAPDDPRE